MAIVAIILWERQARIEDGKFSLRLRVTHQRKASYQTLAYVHKRHWQEKQGRVTIHDPHYSIINKTLADRKREVEELIEWYEAQGLEYTSQQILSVDYEAWKKDKGKSVIEVSKPKTDFAKFLVHHRKMNNLLVLAGKHRVAQRYESQANMFQYFLRSQKNVEDIRIAEIDETFVLEYFAWCKTRRVNKMPMGKREKTILNPNNNNTLLNRLIYLVRVINNAHEKGIIQRRPFNTRTIKEHIKREKTLKSKLTREEVSLIESVDLTYNSKMQIARDTWILQFYLYGTRISDILNLRNKWVHPNEDWSAALIEFHHMKTDAIFTITVTNPNALTILKKYQKPEEAEGFVLPILNWSPDPLLNHDVNLRELEKCIENGTAFVNWRLKVIAKLAGVDKPISTHVSRHSVAFQAQKAKVSLDVLQKAFRHSTIGMTAVYMKELGSDEVADAMKGVYDN